MEKRDRERDLFGQEIPICKDPTIDEIMQTARIAVKAAAKIINLHPRFYEFVVFEARSAGDRVWRSVVFLRNTGPAVSLAVPGESHEYNFFQKDEEKLLIISVFYGDKNSYLNTSDGVLMVSPGIDQDDPASEKMKKYRTAGDKAINEHDCKTAIKLYRKALYYVPDDWACWEGVAMAAYNMSRFEEAEIAIKHALELYPDNVHGQYFLGQIYAETFKSGKALYWYKKAFDTANGFNWNPKLKEEVQNYINEHEKNVIGGRELEISNEDL